MKQYKKNKQRFVKEKQKKQKNYGFTIIETLFSLLLISLAVLFVSKTMVSAINANKQSGIRFSMLQRIEFCKNQLVAKPFSAIELEEGSYSKEEHPFKMNWEIKNLSPTLKIIRLSISYKGFTKRTYFYKSKHIKNKEPEEVNNA